MNGCGAKAHSFEDMTNVSSKHTMLKVILWSTTSK
jgi:hypothetical protein